MPNARRFRVSIAVMAVVIVVNKQGNPITLAMQLGEEMHWSALQCAKEKLSKLRPGGFILEPRYRYDRRTGTVTLMSTEQVQALLRQGLSSELLGTLVPDVVIHAGSPLQIQVVYDFKFPCVNTDKPPPWRDYPEGHPYEKSSQGEVYEEALGIPAARVVPRLGVIW